jgi:hypothetical protein
MNCTLLKKDKSRVFVYGPRISVVLDSIINIEKLLHTRTPRTFSRYFSFVFTTEGTTESKVNIKLKTPFRDWTSVNWFRSCIVVQILIILRKIC